MSNQGIAAFTCVQNFFWNPLVVSKNEKQSVNVLILDMSGWKRLDVRDWLGLIFSSFALT